MDVTFLGGFEGTAFTELNSGSVIPHTSRLRPTNIAGQKNLIIFTLQGLLSTIKQQLHVLQHPSVPQDDEIGILLMGVTGHGKSATGNSILGRREFVSRGGGSSVTKDYHVGYTRVKGRIIKVVDIPGFADTDESTSSGQHELVINALTNVLTKFPNGFHAVLLVVSYTNRLTEELQKSMRYILRQFDEDAFRMHGVLILTSGDSFERDYGWGASIHQVAASGYRRILDICGGRCVLFDNVSRDEGRRQGQVDRLLDAILNMNTDGSRYIPKMCRYTGPDRDGFERDRRRSAQIETVSRMLGLLKDDLYDASRLSRPLMIRRIQELKEDIHQIDAEIDELNIHDPNLKEKLSSCLGLLDFMAKTGSVMDKNKEQIISGVQKDLDKQTTGNRFWSAVKTGLGWVAKISFKLLKLFIFL